MQTIRCRCNGSSGTNCYWCEGSGWVKDTVKLPSEGAGSIKTKSFVRPPKTKVKKEFKEIIIEEKKQKIEIPKIVKPKISLTEQIEKLRNEIQLNDINKLEKASIIYLRNKIIGLNKNINDFKYKQTNKRKKVFYGLKQDMDQLVEEFEKNFNIQGEGGDNYYLINKVVNNSRIEISNNARNKSTKSLTLSYKFKTVFDNIKEKLKLDK